MSSRVSSSIKTAKEWKLRRESLTPSKFSRDKFDDKEGEIATVEMSSKDESFTRSLWEGVI